MKSILLTTTAIVAFAGAAAAEVSFSGEATLGYNDFDAQNIADDEVGFYWDANVAVAMSQELDNGVTAAASFDFDVADLNNGQPLSSGGYVLSLTTDEAGLYYGDTAFAAETKWASAGDMEADAFSEADGETVLRGEFAVAGVEAAVSMAITDADGATVTTTSAGADDYDQISVGVAATFGQFTVAAAYQEEADAAGFATAAETANGDFNAGEVYGISASTSFSGADLTIAYAEDTTAGTSSTGIKVAYPFGPVTATAYYVDEAGGTDTDPNYGVKVAYANGPIAVALDYQDDQGTTKTAVDGSYDIGNGFAALAGYYVQDNEDGSAYDDEFYVAGTYDLGGGAAVLVSYAGGADNTDDEIGANDYKRGATVEVSFAF